MKTQIQQINKMREIKINAIFKGLNNSCGYLTDKQYLLIVRHKKGENIIIEDYNGGGYCEYSSIISFLENWNTNFIYQK